MPSRYFSEGFEGYQLEGRVLPLVGKETELPKTLAIHGARSDYTKLNGLLYPLQALGVASLSFNLSGHNTTVDVKMEDTSLAKNLQESLRFAGRLGTTLHTVFGHSMGGALALKVAEAHRSSVKKIVLICPALYSDVAYERPFGASFREEISVPFRFLDSSTLIFLREFDGELMLVIGQYDGLNSTEFGSIAGSAAGVVRVKDDKLGVRTVNSAIPFEVIASIEKSLTPRQFRKIVLPGCDHAVSTWLRSNPTHASGLASEIAEFVNRRTHV